MAPLIIIVLAVLSAAPAIRGDTDDTELADVPYDENTVYEDDSDDFIETDYDADNNEDGILETDYDADNNEDGILGLPCPGKCKATCDRPNIKPPKECTFFFCTECAQGYVFLSDTSDECVKICDCPGVHPPKPCPEKCKVTCDRPNYKPPKECASYPACYNCPPGSVFLNANSNECVELCDCPSVHPPKPCPEKCKVTCDRPNYKPPKECASYPACYNCPPGSVFLNANSNECVELCDCPSVHPPKPCPEKCKVTCDRPNYKPPKECASYPACYNCPAGYVFLNANSNECVELCDCPSVHPPKPCPEKCKVTCDRPNYKPPKECASYPACYNCPPGSVFLNANSNECVELCDCPSVHPPKPCPEKCKVTCDRPNYKPPKECASYPACYNCPPGSVFLNANSNKCVELCDCPSVHPPKPCPEKCKVTCDRPNYKPPKECASYPACYNCPPGSVFLNANSNKCVELCDCPSVHPPKPCPEKCKVTCDRPNYKPPKECASYPACYNCPPGSVFLNANSNKCVELCDCPSVHPPKPCPEKCKVTCDRPNYKPPKECASYPACYNCPPGSVFLNANSNKCVELCDCPSVHPPKPCPEKCKVTCDRPNYKPPKECASYPACYNCPPGSVFLNANSNKCVELCDCPSVHPPKPCQEKCKVTCDRPNYKPPKECASYPACYNCPPGSVFLNANSNKCVELCDCPSVHPPKPCPEKCKVTCDRPNYKPPKECASYPACYNCPPGSVFLNANSNKCVELCDCPSVHPPKPCPEKCKVTCDRPNYKPPKECASYPACYNCPPGSVFLNANSNKCVELCDCPSVHPPKPCPEKCKVTCDRPNYKPPKECASYPACYNCPPGSVFLNANSNKCVELCDCPSVHPPKPCPEKCKVTCDRPNYKPPKECASYPACYNCPPGSVFLNANSNKCVELCDCPSVHPPKPCPEKCKVTCDRPNYKPPKECASYPACYNCPPGSVFLNANSNKCVELCDCPSVHPPKPCPEKCKVTCDRPNYKPPKECASYPACYNCPPGSVFLNANSNKCVELCDCPSVHPPKPCPEKCKVTCDRPNYKPPKECASYPACYNCPPGSVFLNANSNKCVELCDCPSVHPPKPCPEKCKVTCDRPNYKPPKECASYPACYNCPPGSVFLNANSNKCVELCDCPSVHPPKPCPEKCKVTCDRPNYKPPKECASYPACYNCPPGSVFLNANSNKCVELCDCPSVHPPKPCPEKCKVTCDRPNYKPPKECASYPACYNCPPGSVFLNANSNKCVELCDCPSVHPPKPCPEKCKVTCDRPNYKPPKECASYPACYNCPPGSVFLNANSNKCVELCDCPSVQPPKPCPEKCKVTCDRPNYKPPKECASYPACYNCPAGYVFLNANSNECVELCDCPSVHPPKPCPEKCKVTCDRPNYIPPKECASNPSCYLCPAGYVFLNAHSNDCVKICDCPSVHPPKPCPEKCKVTCDRPNYTPPKECASNPSCYLCPAGYVFLNAHSNDCVKICDCPSVHPPKPCPEKCKVTCDRPNYIPPKECASNPSCYLCPAGYVFLNANSNDCVKICDCPSVHPPKPCPEKCKVTCDRPNYIPPKECASNPSCYLCPAGYVFLNANSNDCVKICDCPSVHPPKPCPEKCKVTCDRPNYIPPKECASNPSCYLCPAGYVFLNANSNDCVELCDCPSVHPPKPCPEKCKVTCDRPNYIPPKECASNPSCYLCPAGYVFLNANSNDCVKICDCPSIHPPKPCPEKCKVTCDRPNYIPPKECASNPSCYLCPAGYVFLNAHSNDCVKICDCPSVHPPKPCPEKCKVTCDRPNYIPPKECASNPSCYLCPAGYVFLNANSNDCVKICDCPSVHPPKPCPEKCKVTCDQPNYIPPKECASNPSCYLCPAGYVFLNANSNDCVKICDCPSKKPCPKKCKQTCTQPIPPKSCAYNPKCFCPPGYVYLNALSNKCVKICDCKDKSCNGDPNAQIKSPVSACPPTCDNPKPNCQEENFIGCECKPGYILDKPGGKCIKYKECPNNCNGDPNAHLEIHVTACPPTCDNPNPDCKKMVKQACVCNPGYILDKPGGICVKIKDCPCKSCNGDPNAHIESPVSACPPTCDNPHPNCQKELFIGCACNPGYILDKPGGKCIKQKDCPCDCNGDPNAHLEIHVTACPPTCDDPHPDCKTMVKQACVCNPGYILDKPGGKCIKKEDCPCDCNGDPNAHLEIHVTACPPTCDDPHPDCKTMVKQACVCNPGYILDKPGGKCIKKEDCPCDCNGDPNAHLETHVTACPPTCDNPNPDCKKMVKQACVCNPGYILDKPGGICVKIKDCPCKSCNGDPNAHIESPVSACPPTCDNPHPNCQKELFIGCACNPGYILDKPGGKCIKQKDCPCNCGPNEAINPCPTFCWTDSCKDLARRGVPCESLVAIECIPACQCKDGYARDDNGNCIPIDQCPC